jgi:hypothetical protein
MLLVFTIASGIGYQSSKTIEQRENDVRDLRTFLYGRFGIELYYTLIEREMDGVVIWDSATQQSSKEKQIRASIAAWRYIDVKRASNMATTIFRGKVVERSTQSRGMYASEKYGEFIYGDVYRELTVEVVDMIKGDKSKEIVLYKEPGGESEDFIYVYDEIDPLTIGKEYIFFLRENNTFISPWTVLGISDGKVMVSTEMVPESLLGENGKRPEQGITVEAYTKALKQRVLFVTAIKGLIYAVVIGSVLVICYFIGRNLYKTTQYVVRLMRKQ